MDGQAAEEMAALEEMLEQCLPTIRLSRSDVFRVLIRCFHQFATDGKWLRQAAIEAKTAIHEFRRRRMMAQFDEPEQPQQPQQNSEPDVG